MPEHSALRTPHSALAIVGIGCLFPKAGGPGHFWANVKHGVDCITDVPGTHWDPADYFDADPKRPDMTYGRRGGFLTPIDFNPLEFGIPPKDLEATDTSQLLGLVAAKQALLDAGIVFDDVGLGSGVLGLKKDGHERASGGSQSQDPRPKTQRSKTSVILGVTGTLELVIPLGARLGHPKWKKALKDSGVPDDVAKDVVDRIGESYVPWQENSFPGLLGNVVAGRIANKLDLHGTNCVVDAACASSLSAVHLAAMELQTGKADVVVTGGADTFNDIFMFMCFSKTPALSPTGDSKPFDAAGDGTILGEGLGMVVLKRLADAKRDGNTIYAVLKGIGTSSDGKGNAIYAPSAEGQKRCLKDAYERAGIDPRTVELVEAHGTGTRVGDAAEATALVEVFSGRWSVDGKDTPNLTTGHRPLTTALGSVKSQIGHTKAAAGAASLIKVALALHNKVLPPTLKVTQPVEPLASADSPFYVNGQMRPWLPRAEHPRRAGLSAFGFGGSNFHAVLEEYEPSKREPDWDGRVEILALSGTSPAELAKRLDGLETWPAFARAAAVSRTTFDVSAPHRLLLVAERDTTDLAKLLNGARTQLQPHGEPGASATGGIHYGTGSVPGKLAVLFPGQGSQAVGMLRELACTFPEMLDALVEADEAVGGEPRLSDRIYPPTSFDPDAKKTQEEALRATDVAQPALGATSWGAYRLLKDRFGLAAEGFAGHSYGEIVALAAAGRLTPDELFSLSKLRGELMAARRSGDAGTMLAVLAPLPDIEKVIRERKLGVVVANKNAPLQTVVSGPTAEVEKAAEAFAAAKLRTVKLSVAAAFHSELVAEASKPFRAALDEITLPAGTAEVFANSTAAPYPAEAMAARDLLGFQLAKPVEFVAQVKAMAAAGYRTFLEVGPGHTLTRLAEAILSPSPLEGEGRSEPQATSGVRGGSNRREEAPHPAPASPGRPSPSRGEGGMAIALDASRHGTTLDLAHALAKLAARGHVVNLAAWERGSRCRPAERPAKPAATVAIGGANHVQPRAKRPPAAPYRNGTTTPSPKPNGTGTRTMTDPTPDLPPALQVTQQALAALRQLHDQTAELHRRFLDQQESAQRALHALISQQQGMFAPGAGVPAFSPPLLEGEGRREPQANGGVRGRSNWPEETPHPGPRSTRPDPLPQGERVKTPAPASRPAPADPTPPVATGGLAPAVAADIANVLLAVVAEKTGYPADMLHLDMALDADLGVDSIKRVEILSAIQDKLPAAPVVKPEHLGTLHTLKDVADFLAGGIAKEPSTLLIPQMTVSYADVMAEAGDVLAEAAAALAPANDIATVLLNVVAEKTGYPADMLHLDMALDADLGVDSIKRVEILSAIQDKLPAAPVVKPEHLGTLHTLKDVADFLAGGIAKEPSTLLIPQMTVSYADVMAEAGDVLAEAAAALAPANDIATVLLNVVAEKTGYPADMLHLDMALDADLGVDSIKRVEILSAIQDKLPAAPVVKPEHLGTLHTLKDVADFLAGAPASESITQTAPISSIQMPAVTESILFAKDKVPVAGATAVLPNPPERISLTAPPGATASPPERVDRSTPQAVDLDLGAARPRVPLAAGAEVWVVGNEEPLAREVLASLKAEGFVPKLWPWADPDTLKPAGSPAGLLLVPPHKPGAVAVNRLGVRWLQAAAAKVKAAGRGGVVASAARLDGTFGLGDLDADADTTAGGLAGLVKTVRHEWPDTAAKAMDVEPAFAVENPTGAAAAVVEEFLAAGPVEVGIHASHRCTLELARAVRKASPAAPTFGPDDVIVLTGGARGVTAEVAVALAETFKSAIVLSGRSPAPPAADPDHLAALTDEAGMKAAIAANLGSGATPKAVGEAYAKVTAQREIRETLKRVEAAGSKVAYVPADVASPRAVADLLHRVQVKHGPVTALVHGAGVLADRKIEDLTADQFDAVYKTKVDGLRNLLDLLGGQELKALVLFSSTTARLGRTGQLAYAVANEVLNKAAQRESRRRPNARVVAINWGPWDGGMVTPALRKVFENEGVGLIPPADGGRFAVRELAAAGRAAEVVALGQPRPASKESIGLPPQATTPAASAPPQAADLAVAFERVVDIASHPVLASHVLDGRAVLPLALHMEWMAHAALHGHPGLAFHGFNEVRVTNGVMVTETAPATVRALAGKAKKADGLFVVPVELRGRRANGKDMLYSRGEVVLANSLPKPPAANPAPKVEPYPHPLDEAYEHFLFHGHDLHGIRKAEGVGETGFVGTAFTAPAPAEWFRDPPRGGWLADPLVLDASFQMAILWSFAQHGAGSLPCFAGRYRQYARAFPDGPVGVAIRVTRDDGSFARADIDYLDAAGTVVARLQDYECVIDPQLNEAFRRNRLGKKAVAAR